MRRRTQSHPCVPQKGRHNLDLVQIRVSGQPVTSGLCSSIVASTPEAGPRRHRVNSVNADGQIRRRFPPSWTLRWPVFRWTRFVFAQDNCRPLQNPSFCRHQKCRRLCDSPRCKVAIRVASECPRRPGPLSAFPAFSLERPKKNTDHRLVIWQHSDWESVFLFRCVCLQLYVSVFSPLAAISRFLRKAAHLQFLNTSLSSKFPF